MYADQPARGVKSLLLLAGMALATLQSAAQEKSYDVVVYGATASGVMAATAAAQQGMHVALVDPGHHVGGMVSGGLSHSDVDRQENVIGGLTLKFFQQMARHYGQATGWSFEPHFAEQTFREWLQQAHVDTFFDQQIAGVDQKRTQITRLHTAGGQTYAAQVFIDSSYEGDLMKAAHVSYVIGREGRDTYGESLAGRMDFLPGAHQFPTVVVAEGLNNGAALAPKITTEAELAPTGSGDGHFQAYCYRLILTDDPKNRLPVDKPEGYDPRTYELLKRYVLSNPTMNIKGVLGLNRIPNGKADANSNGPVSLNFMGANAGYPDGTPQQRQAIAKQHMLWAQGLVYFMQNDPSVPAALQSVAREWGLPKDEFQDTGHWPNQLYVREGRKMRGEYVLTQADLQTKHSKTDAIGVAGYNIDIREVQWVSHMVYRFPKAREEMFTEGYLSQPVDPWQIPYRALLPAEKQATNLLVPVCISASTIAYASFRVEPTYMVAGESAGVAAALAVSTHKPLHHIDISKLQKILQDRGQILSLHN